MIAYHNDIKIKNKYVSRVKAHALADEIMQGYGYWKDGKGCAVGCTLHSDSHKAYETELGIPMLLARLEDGIFEGLPVDKAKQWPLQFLQAINVGADLSMVWPKFAVWMLVGEKHGVIKFAKTDKQKDAITYVAGLYHLKIEGAEIDINDWLDARRAAYAAYAAAAAAAADAAYADAAYADAAYAAAAAAYAAAAAAYADAAAAYADAAAAYADAAAAYADAAADAAAARQQVRVAQSEKLIEILRECK